MRIGTNSSLVAKKIIIIVIILSTAVVGVNLLFRPKNDNHKLAEDKFVELARDYYENYYHPGLIRSYTDGVGNINTEMVFRPFSEHGFPMVRLRNLLLYDNSKNEKYRGFFEKPGFSCDTNSSMVIFKPVSPFGEKNYTISYELYCK